MNDFAIQNIIAQKYSSTQILIFTNICNIFTLPDQFLASESG